MGLTINERGGITRAHTTQDLPIESIYYGVFIIFHSDLLLPFY
jgi:hypothetical protein